MNHEEFGDDEVLPLRDRIPEYIVVFAIGLGGAAALGLVLGLLLGSGLWTAVGYTIAMLGVVLLLAGGASGGGYTSLGIGAVGGMFGGRRVDEEVDEHERRRSGAFHDPMERLRKGLRPEANPRAFWQVIAGILYIIVGIWVVSLFGG
ncbi:MAG: hypothetical protein ABFS21_00875 [Actinomycetota bacterium]